MTLDLLVLLSTKPKTDLLTPALMLGGLLLFTLFFTWLSKRGKKKLRDYEVERETELYSIRRDRRVAQLARQGRFVEDDEVEPTAENGGAVETIGAR
jgi:hypothetical protein